MKTRLIILIAMISGSLAAYAQSEEKVMTSSESKNAQQLSKYDDQLDNRNKAKTANWQSYPCQTKEGKKQCFQVVNKIYASINEQELSADLGWYVDSVKDAKGHSLADFTKDSRQPRLHFKDGQLHVSGACNRYLSSYQLDSYDMKLSLGEANSRTKMTCEPELMARDKAFERFMNNNKLLVGLEISDSYRSEIIMKNKQGDILTLSKPVFFRCGNE
ncbi:Heat shock protein [Snodgrassella alvi SCGC AB-598-O02]|nr:META domain-containing protein [Snodgrassella alvi]KES09349.1 Heat shock protein [Snodgrassella alvi SCGC AB-598-O02]